MNRKVLTVLGLTVVAIVLLAFYSFGPRKEQRARTNPASLKPSPVTRTAAAAGDTGFIAFHNRDSKEDYYTVAFPRDWHVQAGNAPGSYALAFNGGTGSVGLMDVPDNTTLELYVLSQEEPRLKKTLTGYQRLDYQKTQVNGNEAHQLTYQFKADTSDSQTVRTYISGQNQAAVATFTVHPARFAAVQPVFSAVLNTLHWENR